jgi:hypothetical protein
MKHLGAEDVARIADVVAHPVEERTKLTGFRPKMVAEDSIPQEGLAAEYRLDQHVALDSANFHHGQVYGGSWESSEP